MTLGPDSCALFASAPTILVFIQRAGALLRASISPQNRFVIYGERKGRPLAEILRDQMQEPYFPIEMEVFQAAISFVELGPGEEVQLGPEIWVTTHRLNHPNQALGYVVHVAGKRVAYVTDHEHEPGELSPAV